MTCDAAPQGHPVAEPGQDFLAGLQRLASQHYHHRHPFNLLMHAGRLSRDDLRRWVRNRYYYQTRIPIKDALIVAKSEDAGFRRAWARRLGDHDGAPRPGAEPGGLELWVRLGRALGLSREELQSEASLLPEVRRACDEYVERVRAADLVTAVAFSLTECFAGGLMQARIDAWREHYGFVDDDALAYFRRRVAQAPEDADHALHFVIQHARVPEQQSACLDAFREKCAMLWRLLDAVYISGRRELRPRLAERAWLMKLPELSRAGAWMSNPASIVLVPEKALELNQPALDLLEACERGGTLAAVTRGLALKYGVPESQVELDIATFVGELERRKILVFEA